MFTFTDVAAVMIRFNATMGVGGVDVKSVQVSTYGLYGGEVLVMRSGVKETTRREIAGSARDEEPAYLCQRSACL